VRKKQQLSRLNDRVDALETKLTETGRSVNAIRQMIERLDTLIRELHTDTWNVSAIRAETIQGVIQTEAHRIQELVRRLNDDEHEFVRRLNDDGAAAATERHEHLFSLISKNHADTWDADEKRALSLADVVLLSMTPRIESMKQELMALIGEKAVEVFREQSHDE